MKIKIVKIAENSYDIYYGFTGIPSTFPFHTKWVVDKKYITKEEAAKYVSGYALDLAHEVILKF